MTSSDWGEQIPPLPVKCQRMSEFIEWLRQCQSDCNILPLGDESAEKASGFSWPLRPWQFGIKAQDRAPLRNTAS
jgi:hypothetical protein